MSKRIAHNFKDITGKRFGRLTVVKQEEYYIYSNNKKRISQWLCKCDCGKFKIIKVTSLNRGTSKSCGCLTRESFHGGNLNSNRKDAYSKYVYRDYKRNALDRNIYFDLTIEDVYNLIFQNCFYCNIEPLQKSRHKGLERDNIFHNGIDRINNDKGYVIDNVVTCCKDCNYAKKNMNQSDFYSLIKRISNNLKNKNLI